MRKFAVSICFGAETTVQQDRKSHFAKGRLMVSLAEDGTQPSAARVGADLRAARERLGWTLPALAAHLRIRLPHLEALEDGRIADLPAAAYAAGFLRTYATALGLDPAEMGRRFRAEAAEANRKTELNFPAPVPERGVPAGAVVLVGALLAIGAYAGWYRMSEAAHPMGDAVQRVPERLAALVEPITPPPPPAAPAAAPLPPVVAEEAPAIQMPAVSPGSAAAAMPPASAPAPPPSATPAVVVAAVVPPLPTLAAGTRIAVHARANSWVQVRDKAGQVLLNRVLRGGETWPVPDRPALLLTTGNAGGTELLVDGAAAGSLGTDGAVRRDLPLDADAIRAGWLAPAPKHP